MSKPRTELKNALRALDVSKPLRIPQSLGFAAPSASIAPTPLGAGELLNTEESGSKMDPVQLEQSPKQTVSKMDSVQNGPSSSKFIEELSSSAESVTGSKLDSVQNEPCEKRRGSKLDPVAGVGRGFTKVPHGLLRDITLFSEPIDFMIYLHLFTYSYGWDRDTASMALSQLERFTRSGRNTVKRALDRLQEQGWIECIEEYEHARMSRKWRVKYPEGDVPGPATDRSGTGSILDGVQNGRCPEQTLTGSKTDPLRGSKMDPFIEHTHKEPSKNSLSRAHVGADVSARGTTLRLGESGEGLVEGIGSEILREYFAQGSMTPRKRHSELQAYHELKQGFADAQIAACVEYLARKGLPGSGERCHSPMAFLSKAMGQVLGLVQADASKREEALARVERERVEQESKVQEAAQEERLAIEREDAFCRAFPSAEEQAAAGARYGADFKFLARNPGLLRKLAIGGWARSGV